MSSPEVLVGREERGGALDRGQGRGRAARERPARRARQRRLGLPGQAVPVVHGPHLAVAPVEVLCLEVGVAQHARKAGGQQPRAGPDGRVDDVCGTALWSRSSRNPIAGHSPGSVWSHLAQRGFGSGGATVTSASSAISRANTAA